MIDLNLMDRSVIFIMHYMQKYLPVITYYIVVSMENK